MWIRQAAQDGLQRPPATHKHLRRRHRHPAFGPIQISLGRLMRGVPAHGSIPLDQRPAAARAHHHPRQVPMQARAFVRCPLPQQGTAPDRRGLRHRSHVPQCPVERRSENARVTVQNRSIPAHRMGYQLGDLPDHRLGGPGCGLRRSARGKEDQTGRFTPQPFQQCLRRDRVPRPVIGFKRQDGPAIGVDGAVARQVQDIERPFGGCQPHPHRLHRAGFLHRDRQAFLRPGGVEDQRLLRLEIEDGFAFRCCGHKQHPQVLVDRWRRCDRVGQPPLHHKKPGGIQGEVPRPIRQQLPRGVQQGCVRRRLPIIANDLKGARAPRPGPIRRPAGIRIQPIPHRLAKREQRIRAVPSL